jgi:hypothetical protein
MSDLERAREIVAHRLVGHQAALTNAEALGWPFTLADAVLETRARIDECAAIAQALAELEHPRPALSPWDRDDMPDHP